MKGPTKKQLMQDTLSRMGVSNAGKVVMVNRENFGKTPKVLPTTIRPKKLW